MLSIHVSLHLCGGDRGCCQGVCKLQPPAVGDGKTPADVRSSWPDCAGCSTHSYSCSSPDLPGRAITAPRLLGSQGTQGHREAQFCARGHTAGVQVHAGPAAIFPSILCPHCGCLLQKSADTPSAHSWAEHRERLQCTSLPGSVTSDKSRHFSDSWLGGGRTPWS